MKKRLLSMLMAVLMIASLVPATALAADADACNHANVQTVSIEKNAAAKIPGVEAEVCADCGEVIDYDITPFAEFRDQCIVCKNPVTKEVQAAACGQVGLTVTYCGTCGNDMGIAPKGVAALKHDLVFTVVDKPTCTEDGWGYAQCKVCGEPFFVSGPDSEVISLVKAENQKAVADMYTKTGHNEKAAVAVEKDVLDKDGKTVLRYAAVAPTHVATVGYGETVVPVDAKGNYSAYGEEPSGAGRTATMVCPDCDAVVVDSIVLDGLNDAHFSAMQLEIKHAGYLPYAELNKEGKLVKHDGVTDVVYCGVCNKTYGGETISYDQYFKPAYNFGETKVEGATAATCIKGGYTGTTMIYMQGTGFDEFGNPNGYWDVVKYGEEIPALDHDYSVKMADVAPTCTKTGMKYVDMYKCSRCGEVQPDQGKSYVLPKADHAWNLKVLVEATCQHKGLTAIVCDNCGYVDQAKVVYTKVTSHVAADALKDAKEATCTEAGYTGDSVCKWCGTLLEKGEEIAAKGHTPEEVAAVAATCTEKGLTAGSKCSVCGEVIVAQEETPALGHDFKDGKCTRCGEKDPNYVPPVVNPFKDVEKSSPYYDAIIWAADKGVTTGKTADTFGINDGCTRAQIVTFLYRAAGSPEVKADTVNPFTDVSKDSVYYNAILWAVENGITKGTTETTFDPNAVCTRGQIVTFLFRASGNEKVATGTDFADVASGSYCADAVAWAVANKVANGFADGTFRPEATCTRGQAVTFIYRALAE